MENNEMSCFMKAYVRWKRQWIHIALQNIFIYTRSTSELHIMFLTSELLSYQVVTALSISRNLNCEELDPDDEDRVIRVELFGGISAEQRSKGKIFQLVEFLDEHAPLVLSFGAFQISLLVEQIDFHVWEHFAEGGIDEIVEWA